jgi:MFS family permease
MPRNIKLFLVIEALTAGFGGFILPVYVLYFRYYQVSLFEVALLAVIFEATVLLSEIPTGLFADRCGRKPSVIIGFGLFAVSGLIFILFRSMPGFIAAEILFGLAEAFISGAGEALAVDSIQEKDKTAMLKRMYALRSRVRIAVTSIFMVAAGYLFARNISITFYPVLIGGAGGLIVSLFLVSPKSADYKRNQPRLSEPLRNMVRSIKLIPIIKVVFVLSLVANFAFEAADQYWQVLFSELYDLDIKIFGILTAAGAGAAFIAVGPLVRRFSGNIAVPMLLLLLAGIIISSLPNAPAISLPYLIIIYFMARELISPLFSITINSVISSSGRATFLSGYNMTCSVGEVASGLLVGIIASRFGLPVVFVLCGTVLVLVIIVALFLLQRTSGRPPFEN